MGTMADSPIVLLGADPAKRRDQTKSGDLVEAHRNK
jgi:hypothetical protein